MGQALEQRWDWQRDAACRGRNAAVFFPQRDDPALEAKVVCRRCPVRSECLEHALSTGERYGVWGGTTEKERERMSTAARATIA